MLGAIEGGRGDESLLPSTIEVEVEGQRVPVVRLETLADLKRGATGPKDRLVLAVLEDTIRRLRVEARRAREGGGMTPTGGSSPTG